MCTTAPDCQLTHHAIPCDVAIVTAAHVTVAVDWVKHRAYVALGDGVCMPWRAGIRAPVAVGRLRFMIQIGAVRGARVFP